MLAKEQGGEVVSADSMQIYKGMEIGTAKPSPDEMAEVPHHMIDVAEPSETIPSPDMWARLRLVLTIF
jgi:tRNA dimethylallyltransferase